jgi:SAM-dependent methyltransferase
VETVRLLSRDMTFDRTEVLRRGIVASHSKVLEIGPLDNPVLPKPQYDAIYVDYAHAEELSSKYADDPTLREVVDVDVLWDGSSPLIGALKGHDPFDAVVASHVIEHIPDPVRWLTHLAEVLRPGGFVSLAVPDMRFTFDVNRRLNEFSDFLDAYLRRAVVPSYAQLFDYHTKAVPVDAGLLWDGMADYGGVNRPGDLRREAFNACVSLSEGGPYVDMHCHTFTPSSFVDLFEGLGEFGMADFAIAELVPTRHHAWEFFVRLERLDPELTPETRQAHVIAGLGRARDAISHGPDPAIRPGGAGGDSIAPPGTSWYLVSAREFWALQAKRRIRSKARARARRLVNRLKGN